VSVLVRRTGEAARALPWLKAGLGIAIGAYLLLCAKAMTSVREPLSGMNVLVPISIALFPLCAFLSFGYPLIFPFGLYVLITPIDALLAVSGVASLVKLIGFTAAGALLLRTLLQRRALAPQRSWYLWAALVAYASLSIMWTPDYANGANVLLPMLLLFVMMTVLAIYPARPLEFKVMAGLIVVSGLGAAVVSLLQFHSGSTSYDKRLTLHGLTAHNVQDPNYLGGAFLLAIAFALVGVFYTRNLILRTLSAISLAPMIAAVLSTGSRSAFFAAIAIFCYFIVRSKFRLQAFLLGACGFAMTAFYPRVLDRLFASDVGTADGRTDIWRTGMHSFADHWLFGAGIGSYQYDYDRNVLAVFQHEFAGWTRPGHSLIFVALNDFGVIGFVLVLACWFVGFRQLSVIPKTSWLYGTRIGLEAGMIGLFIHMLFLDPFFVKYVWLAQSLPLLVLNLYAPRALRVGRRVAAPVPQLRPAQSFRGT
jgi:O-antigen ligase